MGKHSAYSVLDFWHKLEFFELVNLKNLDNDTPGIIHYDYDEIERNPNCLPWLDRNQIRRAGQGYHPERAYTFKLYFGIFSHEEVKKIAFDLFDNDSEESVERTMNKENTGNIACTSTIKLTYQGDIDKDSLAVSTVPWALGELQKKGKDGLNSISFDAFKSSVENLKEYLNALTKYSANIKSNYSISDVFTTFDLLEFLRLLGKHIGFKPKDRKRKVIIQLQNYSLKKDEIIPVSHVIPFEIKDEYQRLGDRLKKYSDSDKIENDDDKHFKPFSEDEVVILNSFYLNDLETTMRYFESNSILPSSPLIKYLSNPTATIKKPDLLSSEGEGVITDSLSLDNTPLGRWPSENSHTMSLMQQFAINTISKTLQNSGLYSVNGPPGTGKTTMLRDIIADNIVKRADILAKLKEPENAFDRSGNLILELTGFEMVVVSSNNAAVENVSKELPQIKALGSEYRNAAYLKPVAQKIAAKHEQNTGKDKENKNNFIFSLKPLDDCWGLIAAVLGNQKNRNKFLRKAMLLPNDGKMANDGKGAENYRTIAPAIKELHSVCNANEKFCEIQKDFLNAKKRVLNAISEIKQIQELNSLRDESSHLQERLDKQVKIKDRLTALIFGKFNLLEFFRNLYKFFIKNLQIKRIKSEITALTRRINDFERDCSSFYSNYEDVIFHNDKTDIEDKLIQRQSFGHCKNLNRLRSDLTIKAFELHQAWIAAVYNSKNIGSQIFDFPKILSGNTKAVKNPKSLWQLFFMIIPVISSTFASINSQFKEIDQGDIGWLFIDEAGQATPQQAVGALLRAKRAVAVGDPLQIEPVFTIPMSFIEAFARHFFGEEGYKKWSPSEMSVQKIADRVNPYGTTKIANKQWLGSPLRVHRRCNDPMFTISNKIAYNSKMIHGSDNTLKNNDDYVWGPSQWFDIKGEVKGKHYVSEQAEYVLNMIYKYIDEMKALPNVYIITPFRKIKTNVNNYFRKHFSHPHIETQDFNNWKTGRIGTVHTFQGKEEENVILILGVSSEKPGAASWASGKPNILNVASTRAKKRFYVVGCKDVWAGLDYFSTADRYL